jgi:hypothetical protein
LAFGTKRSIKHTYYSKREPIRYVIVSNFSSLSARKCFMNQHSRLSGRDLAHRLTAILGSLSLIAAVFVGGLSATATIASAATLPACTTSNLVVWLNTVGNGAAGSSYYNLNFTNLSGHTCTLQGYPGVSGVSLTNHQVGSSAARSNAIGASTITLTSARTAKGLESSSSHNTATVILQITEVENYPVATCSQISAAGLRVYPPGQTASKVIAFPFAACGKSGPRFLHVQAVEKDVALN